MRLICIAFLLICPLQFFGQEILFEYQTNLRSYESYSVIDRDKDQLGLFLLEKNNVRSIIFNKDFEKIHEMMIPRSPVDFSNFLGVGYLNDSYQLFFSDDSRTRFYIMAVDIKSKQYVWRTFPDLLDDATFLEAIIYNNQFHIISVKRKSSVIKAYRFNDKLEFESWIIDCSEFKYANSAFYKLSDVLRTSGGFFDMVTNSFKVDNSSPSPIELTSRENKIYARDNKLIITMDNEPENTKVLTINMEDFSYGMTSYEKGNLECSYSNSIQSNSFLFKSLLFQTKICSDEFIIQIRDFPSGKLMKEFRTKKDEDILYRNTPLIKDGKIPFFSIKSEGQEKELKSTNALIRNLISGNIGITAFQSIKGYEVTLGSYHEVEHNQGGLAIAPATTGTFYGRNSTFYSYKSYTESISTYFKTLIDTASFEHLEGELQMNGFDRIYKFSKENEDDIISETVFRLRDYFIYGYYSKKNKTYYLRKFTNEPNLN